MMYNKIVFCKKRSNAMWERKRMDERKSTVIVIDPASCLFHCLVHCGFTVQLDCFWGAQVQLCYLNRGHAEQQRNLLTFEEKYSHFTSARYVICRASLCLNFVICSWRINKVSFSPACVRAHIKKIILYMNRPLVFS